MTHSSSISALYPTTYNICRRSSIALKLCANIRAYVLQNIKKHKHRHTRCDIAFMWWRSMMCVRMQGEDVPRLLSYHIIHAHAKSSQVKVSARLAKHSSWCKLYSNDILINTHTRQRLTTARSLCIRTYRHARMLWRLALMWYGKVERFRRVLESRHRIECCTKHSSSGGLGGSANNMCVFWELWAS